MSSSSSSSASVPVIDSSVLRQLSILTGSVRRLGSDLKSYKVELTGYEKKLDQFISEGREESELKRQREFVTECEQTIADIQLRLQAAITKLVQYHQESIDPIENAGAHPDVEKSRKILADTRALMDSGSDHSGHASSAPTAIPYRVLIAGSLPHFPTLITQLSSISPPIHVITQKTPQIYSQVQGMIVLPGPLESMLDLVQSLVSFHQNTAATAGASASTDSNANRSVIAFRSPWEPILQSMKDHLKLSDELWKRIHFVNNQEELVATITKLRMEAK